MYSQLIYFVIVLFLFGFQPPAKAAAVSYTNASYILAVFLFYAVYCRSAFQRIEKQASRGMLLSVVSHGYHITLTRFHILSIAWIFFYIYIFNLKLYLSLIPGFDAFSTVSGLTGIFIYLIHLCVIWYYSYPSYKIVHGTHVGRIEYIKANLSFSTVLLIPWLLISIVTDLFLFLKIPFMSSDLGQTIVVSLALIAFVLLGPWLMVRLWRCEPLPPGEVREELEKFCGDLGFRVGGFLLWPLFGGEMLTAGVVGILPRLRYILITSGLLKILEVDELKAVMAHEMGHVRKKHLLFFVGLFILFMLLIYNLGDLVLLLVLSNRTMLHWTLMPEVGPYFTSFMSSVPPLILMILFFRFVFGFFLRNSERQADIFALQTMGSPLPLVSSFEKIASHSGRVIDLPNWHHYSLRQRIDFIFAASGNPGLIRRHNRKLYGAAVAFFIVFCAIFLTGMGATKSRLAGNWRSEIQLGLLEREITEHPDDPNLLGAYGGLLYEKGRYSEAESVLNAALSMDPDNAGILNNLAWLYATTPEPFRNPSEALDLAERAAEIDPKAHVLDTLAEAYYINGLYDQAIEAIDQAIAKGGPELAHYMKQKKKFELALRGRV